MSVELIGLVVTALIDGLGSASRLLEGNHLFTTVSEFN